MGREGHTGTPPDRVFGIEEKDEFGHGTGKQIQSSAADGFVTAEGKYGYLVVDPVTGKYTYTLYNGENGKPGKVQDLAEGQMEKEEFNVMLNGTRTNSKITITIHGTNDIPTLEIKGEDWNITQGGELSIGGTFTVSDNDRDAGENQTFRIEGGKPRAPTARNMTPRHGCRGSHTAEGSTPATFTTDYGKLTLDPATGQWKYELDNTNEEIQQLNAGEKKFETFDVTVTDEHGATSTQTITVTITGTNDIPVIDTEQSDFHLAFKEQGVYQPTEGGDGNAPTTGGGIGEGQHQTGTLSGKIYASDIDKENGPVPTDHDVNKLNFHVEHAGST